MICAPLKWAQRAGRYSASQLFHMKSLIKSGQSITQKMMTTSTASSHSLQFAKSLPSQYPFDPYNYTSGRWLHRDKLQQEFRSMKFDFDALSQKVVQLCPGAVPILSCEKKEGGFNRVFIFTMNNGSRIVARLPTRAAGPPRLITNSEVATITYLQSNTSIPVPKILDWSDDILNPIGSEYIIMEHVTGVQLHQQWHLMSGEQQRGFIKSISLYIKQLAAIELPAYGSLYFADVSFDGASKTPFTPGFCIGPHCGPNYWDCNVGEPKYYGSVKPNRGPWPNISAYCSGLIDTGLSRLPDANSSLPERPSYYGSVSEHIHLLGSCCAVISRLIEDPRIRNTSTPTLLHADLHKRNIFVSEDNPTVVTGIIDWQSSSIEPAFVYANDMLDFATPINDISSDDQDISVEDRQAAMNAELCRQAFEVCMLGFVPKLGAARALDDRLLRPFRYCHRTWRDGAAAFREELIEISRHWNDLELSGSCPYILPTAEKLLVHQKEFEKFELAEKLKKNLVEILNTTSDGWVPSSELNETKTAQKEAFDVILQSMEAAHALGEESVSESELRAMWPFDSLQEEGKN